MTLFKQPAATQPFSSDMVMRFLPFQPFRTIADVNYVQSVGLSVLYCLKNESVQNKKIHSLYNYILFFRIFESGWDRKPSARPSQEDTCEVWYEFRMCNPM